MSNQSLFNEAEKPPSETQDAEPPAGECLNFRQYTTPPHAPAAKTILPFFNKTSSELPYISLITSDTPEQITYRQRVKGFLKSHFPKAAWSDWVNWKWQLANRVQDPATLARFITLSAEEKRYFEIDQIFFPLSITPYYLSLLDPLDTCDPLRKTVIPLYNERIVSKDESIDPLGEEHDSPLPGIVHRYPDRVLFLVTNFCSTYCRYCTRSRIVSRVGICLNPKDQWKLGIDYIKDNPQIRDVLISGGDPLTLSDDALEWLLKQIKAIPHVEIIRIGSKIPAVLPQRITKHLVSMLKKYHPLYLNLHFSHPREMAFETAQACNALADAGIPLGSQTVLLAGVNDNIETMKALMHNLLKIRVKPYYLYQCDLVPGSEHFRTPVAKGIEIIEGLRGHTTGFAVPTYVIDAPEGGGKIPLIPQYLVSRQRKNYRLRNYKRQEYVYPDVR